MNIEDLRLFTEVVAHGGISEAARHNHMAQQTLSRRIISLEREVGRQLFVRTNPIALTPSGKVVLRRSHEMLATANDMKLDLARLAASDAGAIRVRRYQTDSFFHLLARVMEAVQEKGSNIKFELVEKNEEDVGLVRSGQVDIGFVRCILGTEDSLVSLCPPDGELVSTPMCSNAYPLVFGVPEGHPLLHMAAPTLEDVSAFPVAVPSFASQGAMPMAVGELFRRKGLPLRIDMVYARTMLEYYADLDPRDVCLFNERYSVDSLLSQRRRYVGVRPADDNYVVNTLAIYLRDNGNPALPDVLNELLAADDELSREGLC